jgi:formylglycine-generating enzyme required for sulfatase activity
MKLSLTPERKARRQRAIVLAKWASIPALLFLALAAGLVSFGIKGVGPLAGLVTCTHTQTQVVKTRSADGMVMVYVPKGKFIMGSPDDASFTDEQPQHTVSLNGFWIDRTEVTNAKYALCVQAGNCQPPHNTSSLTRSHYYGNSQYDDYPVIYVDWDQANTYCSWAGGRLPTEAEWEKAARGTDGRTYPWGDTDPTCSVANFQDCVGDTSAVGSYPAGVSPYGALDMAGNVWEWVADWYSDSYYSSSPSSNPIGPSSGTDRVLRGGSWYNAVHLARSAYRNWFYPDGWSSFVIGFRCSQPH